MSETEQYSGRKQKPGRKVINRVASNDANRFITCLALLAAMGVALYCVLAPRTTEEFVVFSAGTPATVDDDWNLWRVSLDGSGLRQLTTGYRLINTSAVSKDGKTIVFSGMSDSVQGLFAIDERGDITQLTTAQSFRDSHLDTYPDFHPDGRTVVFQRYVSVDETNIMELDVATGGASPLIANSAINRCPSISPDGKSLIYVSNVNGKFQLFVADIDGKNPRAVIGHDDYFAPAFGPTGKEIWVGSRSGGRVELLSLDLKGTVLRRIPLNLSYGRPAVRADGTMICEIVVGNDNVDLYVVSREGQLLKQLTNSPLSEMFPAVGPSQIRK